MTIDTPPNFKLTRDFSKIDWKATLKLNLIRAACAGPVFGILALLIERSPKLFLLYTLLFPAMYVVVILPMALIAYWLGALGVPFAGLFGMFLSLMVAVGDPFTAVLSRKRPDLVPVENFGFFNLNPIIFVLYKEEPELPRADEEENALPQSSEP